MWVSTRAQYGLRAMIEIGRQDGQPVTLKSVSQRQNISLHYLEQIVATLRRAGYIQSVRGAKGGYRLSRSAGSIHAYEVVTTLEGSLAPVACAEKDHVCDHDTVCGTQDLWKRVDQALRDVLGSTTLEQLILEAEQLDHQQLLQLR
ncbi:Rrf2 family protein [Deinococcus metalli]|uniref:Rrf2 family protein n=1 Tax=Deinococcus metalli TaxID=1141878 RepID=A0A7W8KH85_9DEIO|nr:Rrf2 family transcriptional regulator [Deinococcus metalli]MBB5376484.1 Rrf2 family protein [Deinococcus metalli]GHF43693.1 hypothetical protein GCM10017781_20170 [Deinococcus metalli]